MAELIEMGDDGGGHWLVRMEWRPAGWSVCLPLLVCPCTIKSRSSLLALAHPGRPGKRAVRRLWCGGVEGLTAETPPSLRSRDTKSRTNIRSRPKNLLLWNYCSVAVWSARRVNTISVLTTIFQVYQGQLVFLGFLFHLLW